MQSSVATKKQFKRPGARVRASFTLENVFLIPLFTMIIVFLMGAGMYLHDNIIIKNALIQGTVILEKYFKRSRGRTDGKAAALRTDAVLYFRKSSHA